MSTDAIALVTAIFGLLLLVRASQRLYRARLLAAAGSERHRSTRNCTNSDSSLSTNVQSWHSAEPSSGRRSLA